jgi:hypothetical protein
MIVIKPDNGINPNTALPSTFLAGSIDNGSAEDWQSIAERKLSHLDINVFNPRRTEWHPDLRQDIEEPEFAYQVNWELDFLHSVTVPFFYFAPTSKAPITFMELGSMVGKRDVVVCCPEGFWRRGNVQIFCARNGWKLYDDLDEALLMLELLLTGK